MFDDVRIRTEVLPPEDQVAGPLDEECVDRSHPWVCTKKKGHAGRHVAHGLDGEAFAQWTDEEAPLVGSDELNQLSREMLSRHGIAVALAFGAAVRIAARSWSREDTVEFGTEARSQMKRWFPEMNERDLDKKED